MQTMFWFGTIIGATIGTLATEVKWRKRDMARIRKMWRDAYIPRVHE